ncbi:hypothetical protein GALL_403380 [mine drainage metagenome]|uniref:Uncharacterized protein n=1 Tax=mine drainage metagenome TaxID=410659 RepID=A0A1J5Q3S4_9ZZZZ
MGLAQHSASLHLVVRNALVHQGLTNTNGHHFLVLVDGHVLELNDSGFGAGFAFTH